MTVAQQCSNAGRGDHVTVVVPNHRDDVDFEPEFTARFRKQLGVARAVTTESEILTNSYPHRMKSQRQDLRHEESRFQIPDLDERQHPHDVHATRRHHARPLLDRRQQFGCSVRIDDLEGVRIECERNRRSIDFSSPTGQVLQDVLMTEVYAIEDSDGNCGGPLAGPPTKRVSLEDLNRRHNDILTVETTTIATGTIN